MTVQKKLQKLVSIDTRYSEKKEDGLQDFLIKELKQNGFSVDLVPTDGRNNIIADNKKSGKAILFYGHIDTVDVVPGWSTNPFLLTVKKDKAFGLGGYDMKGGMTAILNATKNSNRHIKILFAVDEENISEGSWNVVENKKDFFQDVELVISAEPNFGLGLNGITTGRTGRVIFNVTSQGKPVHIAKYDTGLNAIYPLTNFLNLLEKSNFPKDKMTVVQPRSIETQTIGMSLCESAVAKIEVLLGSDDSIESMKKELQSLANKTNGAITVKLAQRKTPYLPGYRFETFPHQNKIADIINTHTGKKMTLHERSSVGDDNVLATLGIPVITWGPDGGGAHEPNEWVSLSSLNTLSHMYKQLLFIR
jgi:acetylornithine deacetylase/succinyl-diaminopimelate desuccinylase-like protein